MRLLILVLLGYLTYKFVITPFMEGLRSPEPKDKIRPSEDKDVNEDEYIDYEEID